MIKVVIGTNSGRSTVIVDESRTVANMLEEAGVSYERSQVLLNASPLKGNDLYSSLAELGIEEKCSLFAVEKLDNAR